MDGNQTEIDVWFRLRLIQSTKPINLLNVNLPSRVDVFAFTKLNYPALHCSFVPPKNQSKVHSDSMNPCFHWMRQRTRAIYITPQWIKVEIYDALITLFYIIIIPSFHNLMIPMNQWIPAKSIGTHEAIEFWKTLRNYTFINFFCNYLNVK